jgi:hypothetical protein
MDCMTALKVIPAEDLVVRRPVNHAATSRPQR